MAAKTCKAHISPEHLDGKVFLVGVDCGCADCIQEVQG